MAISNEDQCCEVNKQTADCNSSDDNNILSDDSSNDGKKAARSSGGLLPTFPMDLHKMLEEINADCLGHIVSWQLHGRAFRVHDQTIFVRDVLPRFSRSKKFTSFVRQLNLYEFRRISRGKDKGAYYHPKFLRGNLSLANSLRRKRVNGREKRCASDPETEPDFYSMPPLEHFVSQDNETGLFYSENETAYENSAGSDYDEICNCYRQKTTRSQPSSRIISTDHHNEMNKCDTKPNFWSHSQDEFNHHQTSNLRRAEPKFSRNVYQFADVFGDLDSFSNWNNEINRENEDINLYNPLPFRPTKEELEVTRIETPEISLYQEDCQDIKYDLHHTQSHKSAEDAMMIDSVPLRTPEGVPRTHWDPDEFVSDGVRSPQEHYIDPRDPMQ